MYRAYVDGHALLDPEVGYHLVEPTVTLELNKVSSFEYTIYPDNPSFSVAQRMASVIEVWDEQQLVFRGRVLNDEEGLYGSKRVECEGEEAYLLDSVVRPYDYSGTLSGLFAQLVQDHNAQVDEGKRFAVGSVTVTDGNDYVHYSSTTYPNTWDEMMDKLVGTHGGYIFVRHEDDGAYLDYLADFTTLSNQPVRFGSNLLDFARTTTGDELATALIPLGAKGEDTTDDDGNRVEGARLTIASVNNGVDYIYDEDAVERYGWIFRTATWDDVTIPANLKAKGEAELDRMVLLGSEIELSAVDLSALGQEYSSFHLGTYVSVDIEPRGVKDNLLVTKLDISLTSPSDNTLTLGKAGKTLTEQQYGPGGQLGSHETSKREDATRTVVLVYPEYYLSTSMTELAGGSWSRTVPEWEDGRYIWMRIVTAYSDGTSTEGQESCITGDAEGPVVTDIRLMYYLSESDAEPTGGEWTETMPEWEEGTFLFTRYRITYDNGTTKDSEPAIDHAWSAASAVVVELDRRLDSVVSQTEEQIMMEVASRYFLKSDGDTLVSQVSTNYEQLYNMFNFQFTEFEQDLSDLADGVDATYSNLVKYIRFVNGEIWLGTEEGEGEECRVVITNEAIRFFVSDVEVASITNNELHITNATVTDRLDMGNFSFQPRENGNLSLVYIGG